MVIFYKKWKKYNEFQLTKNKMDLNIRKMTNHPPSPDKTMRQTKTERRGVSMEKSKAGTKERSPDSLSLLKIQY